MKFLPVFLFTFFSIWDAIHAETFTTWQTSHFTPAQLSNNAISGSTANLDGDSFTNLQEYAFALEPFIANGSDEALGLSLATPATDGLLFTYAQSKTATDLLYQIEYTDDLTNNLWNLLTNPQEPTAPLDLGQVWQRSVLVPSHFPKREFLRLRLHQQTNMSQPIVLNDPPQQLLVKIHEPFVDVDLAWIDRSNQESGYRIERRAANTSSWTHVGTTAYDTRSFRDQHLTSDTLYYYRVRAVLYDGSFATASSEITLRTPLDSDNDNLPDWFEVKIGTSSTNRDSDNDGLDDAFELLQGTRSYGYADIGNGAPESTSQPIEDENGNPTGGYTPGAPGDSYFDPNNDDSNGNGIPDGDEDPDNDGLTNTEEDDLGTYPDSIEIIPHYSVLRVGERDSSQPDYFDITDSGILVKHDGTIWKQGGTDSLGNVYCSSVSSSGWVAINPAPDYQQPYIQNLNDNNVITLHVYTDAEAKALVTDAPANSTLTVDNKYAIVDAVSENGMSTGRNIAYVTIKYRDANDVEQTRGKPVGGPVYWDLQGGIHALQRPTLPANVTPYDEQEGTWTLLRSITNSGVILGELAVTNPPYEGIKPVLWQNVNTTGTILGAKGQIIGLNERSERLDQKLNAENEAELTTSSKTYDLGLGFTSQVNEANAQQPNGSGGFQNIAYTQIIGAVPDATNTSYNATLWIESLGKNEYVGIDLNKRLAITAEPGTRLISGNAISNNGLILAGRENTSSGDIEDAILMPMEFSELYPASGFDGESNPHWLMVPKDQQNSVKAITPANTNLPINFKVLPESGNATISPNTTKQPQQTLTAGSSESGDSVKVAVGIGTNFTDGLLNLSVKNYQPKTIAIHAVTQKYTTPMPLTPNQGKPNQICVRGGSILWSTPAGDDQPGPNLTITTGANGVCQTTADSRDTQVIPSGQGIHKDLVPQNVPTAQQLQTYLDQVFGLQTNTYITVTRNDFDVDYDVYNKNAILDVFERTAFRTSEQDAIANAGASSTNYNVYYVNDFQAVTLSGALSSHDAVGAAIFNIATAYIRDGASDMLQVTAHEIGHLFGLKHSDSENLPNGTPNPTYLKGKDPRKRLMYSTEQNPSPKLLIKAEWDVVNKTPTPP